MTGIKQMFQEYSGEEVDWFQMAFWFEEGQRRKRERESDWHTLYRHRDRTVKERKARWTAKNPEKARQVRLEATRRWRAKNIEKVRAQDRARQAAKKAQKGLAL